jgi:hypothetical protein
MMARNIHKFYFEISFFGNVRTSTQKNINPRVGIEILVGPRGLEPGSRNKLFPRYWRRCILIDGPHSI